jgi:serine/threonine-protein kinase
MSTDGSFRPVPAPSLVGQVLDGRYRITKKLGEGGMGEVYAAEHVHIDKKYAIKLLKAEIVSNHEAVARFRQEALKSSEIKHRNIIAIEDFSQLPDGRIYMCMELLNGAALNDLIQGPMLTADRLLNILIQTGHGLAAAHARGIVHRDMKPENIFVTVGPNGEDTPKILDFGIAKVSANEGQNHLTRTGTIFGTPFYMAPEQALGNPVDARTDIYAMGVIMYECFAGSLPFQGEQFMGILTQHITTEPEPVAQRAASAGRQLPLGLAEIITRCMQKNPAQRFATMDELVNALIGVYRAVAGAGMSTYMEAFPVGSSQHMAQPTPGTMQRPISGGYPPTLGGVPSAPHPSHASQPNLVPAPVSASGSVVLASGSGKKSTKVGLIIGIVAVLVAGGAIAAIVLLQGSREKPQQQSGSGSGSGNANDNNVNGGSGTQITATNDHPVGSGTGSSAGTGSAKPDPWAGSGATTAAGSNAGSAPPVETVVVVMTQPRDAIGEVWADGKKVDDLPAEVKVPHGETIDVVIKAKGFKERNLTLDGTKTKVTAKLERIPGGGTHHPTGAGSNSVQPPPGHPDCATSVVNPKDKHCINQYCGAHPDDPRCDMQ